VEGMASSLNVIKNENELENLLTEPSPKLVDFMKELDGDIMILGAGGKMGPYIAGMAIKAIERAGVSKKVYAVSRFTNKSIMDKLISWGIETIAADLMDEAQLMSLPEVKNIIYAVGYKFGMKGKEPYVWALNTYLPGRVSEKFKNSRIVAISSGNVYPLVSIRTGGATEETEPEPVGEYAMTRLGGERIFQYFSIKYKIPMTIIRLNYAGELRYGVLVDIALAVYNRKPIDLRMGYVNTIWLGDACDIILRSFKLCSTPPYIINLTGPEIISVRWAAQEFGKLFGVEPIFVNEEEETALLNNASKAMQIFGYPRVTVKQMIDWIAYWIKSGNRLYNKPTYYWVRNGRF